MKVNAKEINLKRLYCLRTPKYFEEKLETKKFEDDKDKIDGLISRDE